MMMMMLIIKMVKTMMIILIDIYLYNKQIPYHHALCLFKKICA